MGLICPNCGMAIVQELRCPECKTSLEWIQKSYAKSQAYYYKGYQKVEDRYLSQAIPYLQKAICFNKYNSEAKNLLGLVYFELGQVGEALKIWILSMAVCKEANPAEDYMERLHKKPKRLEGYKDSVQLYNRALGYMHKKNDDMAVIRLKKAISLSPTFVEARNLLALCYLYEKQYLKAKEQIAKVLEIDQGNEKALSYLKYLEMPDQELETQAPPLVQSPHLHEASTEGHKVKQTYKKQHFGSYIVYFIIGMVCMFVAQVMLIIPAHTEELTQQLRDVTSENNDLQVQYKSMLKETEQTVLVLEEGQRALEVKLSDLQTTNSQLLQENKLYQVAELVEVRQWVDAADVLYTIAQDQLGSDEQALYGAYGRDVYPKAISELYDSGYRAYQNEQYIEAGAYFEKGILYGGDTSLESRMLYYSGIIEEKNNNLTKAKSYYQRVITDYEGTWAYEESSQRLAALAE